MKKLLFKTLSFLFISACVNNHIHADMLNTCYQSGKVLGGAAFIVSGVENAYKIIVQKSLPQLSTMDTVIFFLVDTFGRIGGGELIMRDGLEKLGYKTKSPQEQFHNLFNKVKNYFQKIRLNKKLRTT